jgi:hypothetical protein
MANSTCGWCKNIAHMTPLLKEPLVAERSHFMYGGTSSQFIADAAYICDSCGRLSVVTWTTSSHPLTYQASAEPGPYDNAIWSPAPGDFKEFPDVPSPIDSAASEAWRCHAVGAYRGALVVARAVVEASAKFQGANGRDLAKKIEDLAAQGLIRQAMKEAAHEVRHWGNDVAHGDLDVPRESASEQDYREAAEEMTATVTREEAEEILVLMDDLLAELFQGPARTQRAREAREARKTSA